MFTPIIYQTSEWLITFYSFIPFDANSVIAAILYSNAFVNYVVWQCYTNIYINHRGI